MILSEIRGSRAHFSSGYAARLSARRLARLAKNISPSPFALYFSPLCDTFSAPVAENKFQCYSSWLYFDGSVCWVFAAFWHLPGPDCRMDGAADVAVPPMPTGTAGCQGLNGGFHKPAERCLWSLRKVIKNVVALFCSASLICDGLG